MRRRRLPIALLHVATAFATVLLIAAVVFGVRCYFRYDFAGYRRAADGREQSWTLASFGGSVIYAAVTAPAIAEDQSSDWYTGTDARRADSLLVRWSYWGFWQMRGVAMYPPPTPGPVYTQVGVPYWFIALVAAPLPAWRASAYVRRRRRERAVGRCRGCGYDLRASGERCPECGTPVNEPTRGDAPASDSDGRRVAGEVVQRVGA